jgi:hypothetical protein
MDSSLINEPTVPRSEFRRALNLHCHHELGVGYSDLPDIINIDDVWWEGQTVKEALQMIAGCIQDFKDDMGFKEPYVPVDDLQAPIYSIDE